MELRLKSTNEILGGDLFNTTALNEVLASGDSYYIRELDIFIIKLGVWKDMRQAFKDRDIITDNYNTKFFEPQNERDKERRYTL